jgi:hypothetical protein
MGSRMTVWLAEYRDEKSRAVAAEPTAGWVG